MNWIHRLNARRCAALSLSLLLGHTLNLGSICLAKPIPSEVKQGPTQSVQISVAILSFQDESGTGASAEFCQSLGEHLTKKLYVVPGQNISPKSVRTKAGMEWSQERLSEFGKKLGVQFVVHPGLVAVSSDIAGKITTSKAQVYADIFSVKAAAVKRVEAEGVGVQKGTDSDTAIQLGSADFGSREFHYTSVGQALSKAIDQLAALIYQEVGSGEVAPDQTPLPDDTGQYKPPQDSPDAPIEGGEDDPGATGEAQEAQADEELQQLIAQAQECLNGLNAAKDGEKINALIEALKGLTSALEAKAKLLEQGKVTETDQTDQEIDSQRQELQEAVDQSLPQDQPEDLGPSEVVSGAGESKFDRVVKYVEFGFSVLEKIFDLRARYRGITQNADAPYPSDVDQGAWDTPSEEPLQPMSGLVTEDEDAAQASFIVEKHDLSLAMVQAGENARGPNIADSHLNSWLPSGPSFTAVATGRRRPVAGAEIVEPDSGASARTDNSGFFTIRVPARSTKLIVRKGGAIVAEVAIHIVRGRPTVADIQLSRSARSAAAQGTRVLPSSVVVNREGRNTGTIRGVIQDAKGQPVPRALVDVRGLAMARTDSQGRFSFTRVPAGLQQLTVRSSESAARSEQVRVKSNETTESRIHLDLVSNIPRVRDRLITPGAGSVLRGTVTDNQNRPVPGAKISAVSTTGSGGAVSVHTRADGAFELRDLKPGSYQVLVDKIGLAAASQSVSFRGRSAPPLDFRLKKDATSPFRPGVEEALTRTVGEVRGQVRANNGTPIPNAWIELKGTGKTSPVSPQRTNARGEYVLKALPGRYELRVRAKEYQESSRPVTVQAHDSRRENFDLKFDLKRDTGAGREVGRLGNGALTGRVTDTNTHAPISGAIISVTGRSATTATTDRAGNYSIGNVPLGRQQVNIARGGYWGEAKTVDVRAGSTKVNFDLRPAGSGGSRHPNETGQLKGRVTDEKTGRPISGARITIQGRSDTTDQAGNYVVTDVPLGRYQV
ncbi:MAG: carboxypeptidase regulatory-like domain-containing protein, partial [Pyrinomonadaceae bacterium]